jgi:hypothetical protein
MHVSLGGNVGTSSRLLSEAVGKFAYGGQSQSSHGGSSAAVLRLLGKESSQAGGQYTLQARHHIAVAC